ncbi:Cell division topological specificity factor MinE [hydrothermal vent metagenome]|uniref:Cell division topological specificity factor MinE n=1 Tax=hydrothermal vent metagenome TaxID=652676 RepID=A0A3B0TV85_9ZZZZ
MSILALFRRKKSAPVARERLQVILAHERASTGRSELIARMRQDIVAVIARHVGIETEDVRVKINRRDAVFTLKIDMDIPSASKASQIMDA